LISPRLPHHPLGLAEVAMKLSCILFAATLVAVPSVVSGYSGASSVKAGPAIVPYLCNGGQPANVVYEKRQRLHPRQGLGHL
jgi:hypothetical protein